MMDPTAGIQYRTSGSFIFFCLIAAVNHSISYVGTFYSSSLLPEKLASISLGALWISNAIAGLFFASHVQAALGLVWALYLSFFGFAVQIAGLWIALVFPSYGWVSAASCVFAGTTSALWWNCQSLVVEKHCQAIFTRVKSSYSDLVEINYAPPEPSAVRSHFNQVWTFIYQFTNVICFASLTAGQYLQADIASMIGSLGLIGLISTVLLSVITPGLSASKSGGAGSGAGSKMSKSHESNSAFDVFQLFFSDSRALMLCPFQVTFGVTIALLAFFINANQVYAREQGLYLGVYEAWGYCFSSFSAWPYHRIVQRYGLDGSHFVMQFGAFCFGMCGVLCVCLPTRLVATWPALLIIKALFGLGRGVFEGENRAVYLNLFSGPKLITALSLQGALTGLSGGASFFAADALSEDQTAVLCAVTAAISILSYSCLVLNLEERRVASLGANDIETYAQIDFSDWSWKTATIGVCGVKCCRIARQEKSLNQFADDEGEGDETLTTYLIKA